MLCNRFSGDKVLSRLVARVRRGANAGVPLYPHIHKDGMYVASHTKFEVDYIRVESVGDLEALVRAGYKARMSNQELGRAPSLISSDNIQFVGGNTVLLSTRLEKLEEEFDLDRDSISKHRREQALLRAYLMNGNATEECSICRRTLPENMLVASHIKMRSHCTNDEKLDFDNVAMIMCKLGCDDLFEKGYIVVQSGKVVANPHRTSTPALQCNPPIFRSSYS